MLVAGEASGDLLAAELVGALRNELTAAEAAPTCDYQPLHASLQPRFIGAGGPRMAAAGVELEFDLTEHAVIGVSDVARNYLKFRRLFKRLYRAAQAQEPDAIICVDFAGFNRRFAHAIKTYTERRRNWFHDWQPKLIQYVSPQVWASREGRVYQIARDYDLLLCTFPFEPGWYAKRVPRFPVEFVGNPIVERHAKVTQPLAGGDGSRPPSANLLLLPGSRPSEVTRHFPVLLGAFKIMRGTLPSLKAKVVLPTDALAQRAKELGLPAEVEIQIGRLAEALQWADLALASTGTVTVECAWFGVPTVAIYKTSWATYQIGRHVVTVKFLAMPNLLANEEIFPEFIQDAATPENIARAGLELLGDAARRSALKSKLAEIIATLGGPGAARRAAQTIVGLLSTVRQSQPSQVA